jgi:pyrrolysine biosynthesis protein PylC
MDLEVILHNDELKCIEIDARFPSQTPLTVFYSTRVNMVEILGRMFCADTRPPVEPACPKLVVFEHVRVCRTDICILGEHIMSGRGPLKKTTGFFGANEAITDYSPGKDQWVATMIFVGDSRDDLRQKRQNSYEAIQKAQAVFGEQTP